MGDVLATIPTGDLSTRELSGIISGVLGPAGIANVTDLIRWFDNGRVHLIDDPEAAAQELGTTPTMMSAITASKAFRQAYFRYLFFKQFNPAVLASGFGLLAADFTNPDMPAKDRLAIMRAIGDMTGIAQVQKVEHEITQKTLKVEVQIAATPDDFVDNGDFASDFAPEPSRGQLVGEVQGTPVQAVEAFATPEKEEADGGTA